MDKQALPKNTPLESPSVNDEGGSLNLNRLFGSSLEEYFSLFDVTEEDKLELVEAYELSRYRWQVSPEMMAYLMVPLDGNMASVITLFA